MMNKLGTFLVIALLVSPFLSSPAVGQETPEYEVYAIEYGWLPDVQLSSMLPGADSTLGAIVSCWHLNYMCGLILSMRRSLGI